MWDKKGVLVTSTALHPATEDRSHQDPLSPPTRVATNEKPIVPFTVESFLFLDTIKSFAGSMGHNLAAKWFIAFVSEGNHRNHEHRPSRTMMIPQ